ncbi:hypothetical protein Syun_011997 [Stephania yunnanensis]|uniref:protein disulfide-isomerase n=1 Tax=Stephania yunnanensis TaxID=152371 RepID=A0AAP0PG02_9MAGN
MSKPTPIWTLTCLTLTLLLILSLSIHAIASEEDELGDLEELLAIDEEAEAEGQGGSRATEAADVVSKAQRIVIELNSENTRRVIDGNEFVLVLGYAPWCVRSAEMMPKFAETANALKETGSPLLLAKIDAERYPKAASALGIKGFPTLLLFVNGTSQAYNGGFSAEELVIWARKRTGFPVIRLSYVDETKEFTANYRTFLVGLFETYEGTDYEEFRKAAVADNEIQFVETSDIEVARVLYPDLKSPNQFLGIVKSEPEKYVAFEEHFEKDKILNFLEYNKLPLVNVLTELNSVKVYSGPVKLQVGLSLLYYSNLAVKFSFSMIYEWKCFGNVLQADEFKNIRSTLQEVAAKFKSKVMLIYVDIKEDNLAKPFLTLFGLEESDEAVIVAAFDNKANSKYLLESDPTPSNLENFCLGLERGTLSQYYKSQPIPDNNVAVVRTVVGKTFDDVVLKSSQNVLLEVHAPWCIKCEEMSKQVEKLAKHFKGLNDLIIARIDASVNEHPKLQVDDYPSLLFYPATDKLNPIKLLNKSSLKELAMFIKKNVQASDDRGISTHDQSIRDEL